MGDAGGIVAAVLGTIGAALVLIAAVGIVRMPDVPTRMHASSKAGTLGVIGLVAAAAVHFGAIGVAVKAALIAVFLMLGAPAAAHVIARAAYRSGVPLARDTVIDELRDDLAPGPPEQDGAAISRGRRPD